ncbi:MAG TPA: hypothetical protein VKH42_07605, partial [Vicinamibacterales bacterium]|nr:hypothetical protein [Vicinamibacterales bacterium]
MTLRSGIALLLTVAAAGALVNASAIADGPAAVGGARLKAISSRVSQTGASLVIEASDPVGYVASYPDPLTVVLDFRNVAAEGVANSVVASARHPIAKVTVEPTDMGGAVASRVRVTLTEPVGHHVRAERNTIVVDFDRTAKAAAVIVRSDSPADAMSAIDRQTVR